MFQPLPPTAVSSPQERPVSSGWRLNGVPLNVRTLLLALGLLMAIVLLAVLGYRIVGVGPTDMTLPPAPSVVDPAGEMKTHAPPSPEGRPALRH